MRLLADLRFQTGKQEFSCTSGDKFSNSCFKSMEAAWFQGHELDSAELLHE